jgi:hypothetical protein
MKNRLQVYKINADFRVISISKLCFCSQVKRCRDNIQQCFPGSDFINLEGELLEEEKGKKEKEEEKKKENLFRESIRLKDRKICNIFQYYLE